MPVRLEWQVGDSDIDVLDSADERADRAGPPLGRGLLRVGIGLLYVAMLAAAAWLGFYLGRVSDVRSAHRADIQAALDVERLAWLDRDVSLYESTLSPASWPENREAALARFYDNAPADVELSVMSISRVAPDRSCVQIEVLTPAGRRLEWREYLLSESTWRRTLAGCPAPQ